MSDEDTLKPFRVLSLDGGGMRGLYTATLLQRLALRFSEQKKSADLDIGKGFDLIVGTSTGGILAAGLAFGLPVTRIINLYRDVGPKIFVNPQPQRKIPFLIWAAKSFLKPANSALPLRSALETLFGATTVKELYETRRIGLCLTAVKLLDEKFRVFKTAHIPAKNLDDPYRLVDLCLATSAAPIFLPLAGIRSPLDSQVFETTLEMSKLLNGKRVFIDTQVFRKARFAISAPAFAKLGQLCKDGEVILVTTTITRREINAQIAETASEFRSALAKAGGIAISLGQPDLVISDIPATKISEQQVSLAFNRLVDSFFEECAAEHLELPKSALQAVLDLYFDKKPPFGPGKKKAEFPDAFVLEALKAKAGVNGEALYVISEDSDFVSACKDCAHLEVLPSISHFLDRYNAHVEAVKQVRATLKQNASRIDVRLESILLGLLGDMGGCPVTVEFESRKIVDVLDSLVISCDEMHASVEFICFIEADAWLEILPNGGKGPPEHTRG